MPPAICHSRLMSQPSPRSGGIFMPIGIFGGLAVGLLAGQPTIGVLAGTAAGAAAAALLWLKDRNGRPNG
jgi:hypothetical protein